MRYNIENILQGKPVFDKSSLSYYREEKYGYITVIPGAHPELRETIINPTANYILRLCDGSRSVMDICRFMMQCYGTVPADTIMTDTINCIAYNSGTGILSWMEGGNPFMCHFVETLDNGSRIMTALEDDITGILDYLDMIWSNNIIQKVDYVNYISPFRVRGLYNDVAMRMRLFSFEEDFFLLKEDEHIKGLLSIAIQPDSGTSAVSIGLIMLPLSTLSSVIGYCCGILPGIAVKDITKIKFHARVDDPVDVKISTELINLGFTCEGILKKEAGETDIGSYAIYL